MYRTVLPIVLLLLAACGTPEPVGDINMPPPDFSTAPSPPTASEPQILQVGETATLPDGQTITVHTTTFPLPSPDFYGDPPVIPQVFAANTEWCAGTASVQVSEHLFSLRLDNNTLATQALIERQNLPGFSTSTLAPGECNRGTLTYEVPEGTQPTRLGLEVIDQTTSQPRVVRWEVAASR